MEVYYRILKEFNLQDANKFFEETLEFVIEIENEVIKEAMIFRLQNSKRNLSYIDCIGYVTAKKNGLKFLTGDIQFKDMENVEFVQ